MPVINENETLYIAIFSVGAYQEIISGIGGLHHCLIPEGNELIILSRNGKYKYIGMSSETDTEKMLNVLDYSNKKFIKNFDKKK